MKAESKRIFSHRHCEELRGVERGATKQSPDAIFAEIMLVDCVKRLLRRAPRTKALPLLAMTVDEDPGIL